MNVMAGFDARDSTSVERPKEDYSRSLDLELKGLRIDQELESFFAPIENPAKKISGPGHTFSAATGAPLEARNAAALLLFPHANPPACTAR